MQLHLNSDLKKEIIKDDKIKINPHALGEYILKELSKEDREKILKKIAVDKLLSEVVDNKSNQVIIPFPNTIREHEIKNTKDEILYYLALMQFKGIGSSMLRRLALDFRSLKNLFNAPPSLLNEKKVARSIIKSLSDNSLKDNALEVSYKKINLCKQEGIHLLFFQNEYFPSELLKDDTIPPLIFYKGDISFLKHKKLSIFGKKNPTEFGVRAINSLTSTIASEGYSIISNALTASGTQAAFVSAQNNSPPIVVFPGSMDHFSTKQKRRFINYIVDSGGLVLSVNYPGEAYCYRNLITANKIQLLLSNAAILVESDESLATSQLVMSAKRFEKPIVIPVPPGPYAGLNQEIVKLLKTDSTILKINSRDEYYKIFTMLRKIETSKIVD